MMMDWFRSHHGAPTDPKWRTIAKRAGVAPGVVVSIAWSLLDVASQAADRGSMAVADLETLADFLGYEVEDVERVVAAMTDKGVLVGGRFAAWEWCPIYDRPSGGAWAALRSAVFQRDDFTCTYCGERGGRLECDHIVPVCQGGSHEPENLATACFTCNRSKGMAAVSEWRRVAARYLAGRSAS